MYFCQSECQAEGMNEQSLIPVMGVMTGGQGRPSAVDQVMVCAEPMDAIQLICEINRHGASDRAIDIFGFPLALATLSPHPCPRGSIRPSMGFVTTSAAPSRSGPV